LRKLIEESRLTLPSGLPPISAGLFGYLGYDMIRQVERLPDQAAPEPLGLPEGQLLRPRVMVVFDALRQEILAAAPIRPAPGADPELLVDAARRRIEAVFARLDAPAPIASASEPWSMPEPVSNMEPAQYRQNVETAKNYIRAGDIFQVVPSQRFSAPYSATPLSLYRSLRRTNPSPFLYFFNLPGFAIVGLEPGNSGAFARRYGHRPPDRRNPPARQFRRSRSGP
jgi:anthranilate synthase component 1